MNARTSPADADSESPRAPARKRAWIAATVRIGRLLLVLGLVAGSLLTFPAAIPWMIALWLFWHTLSVARHRPAWLPLAGCLAILLIKRTPWPPALVLLLSMMLAAVVFHLVLARANRPPHRATRSQAPAWERISSKLRFVAPQSAPRALAWATVAALWLAFAGVAIEWYTATRSGRQVTPDPARPIVCLGDSLTAGTLSGGGYPQRLRELIDVPVVNLAREGITSADALDKLPALIEANPQVVVVEIGGHDFLKGFDRATTRANLEEIIETCRRADAEVILMEIPRGFITDPYAGLERELGRRHNLEFISDTPIRKLVLFSPHAPPGIWLPPACHLSDDGLHPNARGERFLAEEVARSLARIRGAE